MPKIIVVQGKKNSLKTTSIRKAKQHYELYIQSGGPDILVAAHLHVNGQGHHIGFASGGDTAAVIQQNIAFFSKHSLDYMVFACRSKGQGPSLINAYGKSLGVNPVYIQAPDPSLVRKIIAELP